MLNREAIATKLIEFATIHNLQIHPGQEPLKWADLLIKRGGHCPCVPERNHCPCEFVMADIKELNRCRCGLFVNGAYIKEFNWLTLKLKERRGRSGPESQRRVPKENQRKRLFY
ncbi:hypothetical protein ES707_01411 [subsurface metagenome]